MLLLLTPPLPPLLAPLLPPLSHARLLSLWPEPSLSFPFSPAATPHQQPAPTTASASKLQPPASAVAAAATASRQQRLQRQQVSMGICLQRPTETATAAAGQHATQARGTAPLAAHTDACTQTTTSQATQTEPEAPTPSRSFWTQIQATSAWNTDLQRQVWSANHRAALAKRSADLTMEDFKNEIHTLKDQLDTSRDEQQQWADAFESLSRHQASLRDITELREQQRQWQQPQQQLLQQQQQPLLQPPASKAPPPPPAHVVSRSPWASQPPPPIGP